MQSAQEPSHAQRNGDGRIWLILNGIFKRPFEAARGLTSSLRGRIVDILRCVNRIASNARRIFLSFSKGSAEIWIGCAGFRHGNSPSRAGALFR
jgi:hypothetical protein